MNRVRGRLALLSMLALAALAVTASSGAAANPARTPILGVVPHAGGVAAAAHGLLSRAAVGTATPTTLTFDSSYETLINRYFADVAAASGTTSNVYSVATQYSGSNGPVLNQSTVGGAYVDKDPLPANGCDDLVDTYCLTDSQLQQEIQAVMTAKGWQGGLDHIFFLMTPQGVGSCVDASPDFCTTNTFCAYHSAFGTISNPVIYANQPYEGHVNGCAIGLGFPNDVDSDTTINLISHEHNESITDPLGDGWIAADGNENGDLCLLVFGAGLGTVSGQAYNQVIDGHKYDLQEEWSNADAKAGNGCVPTLGGATSPPSPFCSPCSGPLLYGGGPVMHTNTTHAIYWLPTAGNTSPPAVTGTPLVGQTLTTTQGTWNDAPTGFPVQWQRCSAAGTNCANISGATATTYKLTTADEGDTVRASVTATNVNGASQPAASNLTAVVVGPPVATTPPQISGKTKVGKSLTASKGTWSGPPQTYRLQWLRCNGGGSSCKAIGKATKTAYKLTKKDAKHRLRVRVTASNAAGTKAALSRATAKVPTAKK
ncbi:MAG TPA: hypothetical protein VHS03_12865, partial [Gaiellaceae bacterium]|jgi:hypothetical protein|nr:hypothetical protein [Gaiellaceae bacterium]